MVAKGDPTVNKYKLIMQSRDTKPIPAGCSPLTFDKLTEAFDRADELERTFNVDVRIERHAIHEVATVSEVPRGGER